MKRGRYYLLIYIVRGVAQMARMRQARHVWLLVGQLWHELRVGWLYPQEEIPGLVK